MYITFGNTEARMHFATLIIWYKWWPIIWPCSPYQIRYSIVMISNQWVKLETSSLNEMVYIAESCMTKLNQLNIVSKVTFLDDVWELVFKASAGNGRSSFSSWSSPSHYNPSATICHTIPAARCPTHFKNERVNTWNYIREVPNARTHTYICAITHLHFRTKCLS